RGAGARLRYVGRALGERAEEIAHDVLLGEPLDQLRLLERQRHLAGEQAQHFVVVFAELTRTNGDEGADLLVARGEGNGQHPLAALAAGLTGAAGAAPLEQLEQRRAALTRPWRGLVRGI